MIIGENERLIIKIIVSKESNPKFNKKLIIIQINPKYQIKLIKFVQ